MFLDKCRTCGQEINYDKESKASRGYLEGAVMTAYAEWQYGINVRDTKTHSQCRSAFKQDFCYEIKTNRQGEPKRVEASSKDKAKVLVEIYTRYAEENGAPIPNADLYKKWKNDWSGDYRFPTYFHFLDFLGLQVDAMPSNETLKVLEDKVDYPVNEYDEEPDFNK